MSSKAADVATSCEHFAYLVDGQDPQRYIFDSGSLRDLVGASDLVSELVTSAAVTTEGGCKPTPDLLDHVLRALRLQLGVDRFSRRACGALCVHADDTRRNELERIKALWRLAVGLRCPGLEFSDCGPVAGVTPVAALGRAYRSGSAVRHNGAATLPPTGHPFTFFSARTGRPATRIYAFADDTVDVLTEAHRR